MKTINKLGMVGLGRMGANMATRLRQKGIEVVGYDVNPELRDVDSLRNLVAELPLGQGAVWLMLPLFAYDSTLDELYELLQEGDMIVDGGNTRPEVTRARAKRFAKIGVHYVDVGTSGGVWGLKNGYAVMMGGTIEEFEALRPVLEALAPDNGGLVHAGPSGCGHFAKMVHNGIEYAMMAAYGEGYAVLTSELGEPAATEVMASWRQGTVIRSWLLDLSVDALEDTARFAEIGAEVPDSGEGRWTGHEIIDRGISAPVIMAALLARFASQTHDSIAGRLQAAVRNRFGGHATVRRDNVS